MAVATEREYGLFINGETAEPASGELRELTEPATGEPLAKAAVANEQDVDRAVDAARAALDGDWGRTAAHRALAPPPRPRRRARRQPQGAGRARGAQRRQGDLVGQGRARPGGRELPLLRLRDRLDRRPLEPGRRLAALLLAERAGRRLRPDRALELPADDDHLEARARPRRRLHHRAEAGLRDAALGAANGRARERGRLPAGHDQRRPWPWPDGRRAPGRATPASRRSPSPARPRPAPRSCGSPPTGSSA